MVLDVGAVKHPASLEKRGPGHRHDFAEAFIAGFERWIKREFSVGVHGEPCAGLPLDFRSRPRRCVAIRRRPRAICNPKSC
jgi:hypothetical protein